MAKQIENFVKACPTCRGPRAAPAVVPRLQEESNRKITELERQVEELTTKNNELQEEKTNLNRRLTEEEKTVCELHNRIQDMKTDCLAV